MFEELSRRPIHLFAPTSTCIYVHVLSDTPPPPSTRCISPVIPKTLGTACSLRDVAWHPHQHVLALAGYGQDAPILLYCGEARADKQGKVHVKNVSRVNASVSGALTVCCVRQVVNHAIAKFTKNTSTGFLLLNRWTPPGFFRKGNCPLVQLS